MPPPTATNHAPPIARLMGIYIPNFSVGTSSLSDLLTIDGAARITKRFIELNIIPEGAS